MDGIPGGGAAAANNSSDFVSAPGSQGAVLRSRAILIAIAMAGPQALQVSPDDNKPHQMFQGNRRLTGCHQNVGGPDICASGALGG